jgi:hypothetical protein
MQYFKGVACAPSLARPFRFFLQKSHRKEHIGGVSIKSQTKINYLITVLMEQLLPIFKFKVIF